jgi:hypothetical protein
VTDGDAPRVVSAERVIGAGTAVVFELIWRWELEPADAGHTRVRHTYDWTRLTDEQRLPRARATTAERLQASVDRLAELAESL